jgi:hypothetical protein
MALGDFQTIEAAPLTQGPGSRAFSSEVDTGSREENTLNQSLGAF